MTIHVHRCARTDVLADALADLLRDAPGDVFTPDLVAVPTKGIERFLSQRLAAKLGTSTPTAPGRRGDGVCANVLFPATDRLLDGALTQASGRDPRDDPWRARGLRWSVLGTIDDHVDEGWAAPLRRYVHGGAGHASGRRAALAARVSDMFTRYGLERPGMIQDWIGGRDLDGFGAGLTDDLTWQPVLWRMVRERIGTPSPPELLETARSTLERSPAAVTMPDRISLFGTTRISALHLEVLGLLGRHREVHLWIPDPSPARWERISAATTTTTTIPSRAERGSGWARHPLLSSFGRDSAEQQLRIASIGPDRDESAGVPPRPDTTLGRLQLSIDTDDPLMASDGVPATQDGSVQVHACHGQHRQVEVIREVILGLLQGDPTLQPRDIVVMCPDVDSFAPLITAAFSVGAAPESGPTHDLRVRVADRAAARDNQVLLALDALLAMAGGRFTDADVLDFAARPVVSHAFGFDEADIQRLRTLTLDSGVRWGLDRTDRERFGLGHIAQNTWAAGLDRMLLGVAMTDDASIGTALPLADVGSGDVVAVGQLAALVARLQDLMTDLRDPHPLVEWAAIIGAALHDITRPAFGDEWQRAAAIGAWESLGEQAGPEPLYLADIRWLLAEMLRSRPGRTNFRSGGITVCGMQPMRSVPHRVICLLGLDDQLYPRTSESDGDDITLRDPRAGERDRAAEDRQLLLDAIMAATDTLVITYTGADPRTNETQPPCVPVAELLDALAAQEGPAAARVIEQPLQPFDVRNFTPGALVPDRPFSHDAAAFAGALARTGDRAAPPPLIPDPIEPPHLPHVSLDDLRRFLRSPAASYLRHTLGLSFFEESEPPGQTIPLDPSGLDSWRIGSRVLVELLAGTDPSITARRERLRGEVPPGPVGGRFLEGLLGTAVDVVGLARSNGYSGTPTSIPIELAVDTPSGTRTISGVVSGVFDDRLVTAQFNSWKPKHDLDLWLNLLALSTAHAGRPWQAVGVGPHPKSGPSGISLLGPREPARVLGELLDLYDRNRSHPLPITPGLGQAFETRRARKPDEAAVALEAARRNWTGNSRFGEATEPAFRAVWGVEDSFAAMISAAPLPDEVAWSPGEPTRLGVLARRIWAPIIPLRKEL